MFPVRTESQAEEIALVRFVIKSRIRKVRDLVGDQIQNGDRLMGEGLLRPVSAVQQGRIVAIGTHNHRCRKTIRGRQMPWSRERELFAAGEIYRVMVIVRLG